MVVSASAFPRLDHARAIALHQGDCLVSDQKDTVFATLLGSCISACIRDRVAEVGGMNHFLLGEPGLGYGEMHTRSARYGAFAMEQLINLVLARGTGRKDNLEFKLFGGGKIAAGLDEIGAKNIAFLQQFLDREGYTVASADLGGTFCRRVLFEPHSGRAFVKRLDSRGGRSVAEKELKALRHKPAVPPGLGDVELF